MSAIATVLLLAASAAAAQPVVVVANMDWDHLPPLRSQAGPFDGSAVTSRMQEIIRTRKCDTPTGKRRDLHVVTLRVASLVEPDGRLLKVAVEPFGCRAVEALVGALAISPLSMKRIIPPGGNIAAWYVSKATIKN